MKHTVLIFAVFLFWVLSAIAQTVIQVPFDKAILIWEAPATGTAPTTYHVNCKLIGGGTLPVVDVVAPAVKIPVRDVVSGPGKYECFITASNAFGEGAASNVLPFDAGEVPGPPANLSVGVE